MDITIKKLAHDDIKRFVELIRVFEEVFEMENFSIPAEGHLQKVLSRDDFYVFVALMEDDVVGGLTAYRLEQYYSELPLVYIFDLAVKSGLQRRGIGKQLIAGINDYCKRTGAEEVFVQADRVDDHAVEFYRSTGGTEEDVLHFYYPLNARKR